MGLPALFLAAGATSAVGAAISGQSQKNALGYQAAVMRNNAKYAEDRRKDAIDAGHAAVAKHRRDTVAFRGRQVASMSESGLSLDSESFGNILDTTDRLSDIDAMTILRNADRQAYGFAVEAQNQRSSAEMMDRQADGISPLFNAGTSLLGSYVGYQALTGGR